MKTPQLGSPLVFIPVSGSSVTVTPPAPLSGTDLQTLIDQIQAEIDALGTPPGGTFLTKIDGEGHTVKDHGTAGATLTVNPADGNWHRFTLSTALTLTLTAPTVGPGCLLQLFVTSDGSSAITWPGTVIWPSATAPTLSSTAGHIDTITLATYDGGANWYGAFASTGPAFATPAIVLGTAAAAGSAATVVRSDSTIAAFDATVPTTQALGDAAATGSVAKAARRDHLHGMPSATDIATAVSPLLSLPPGHVHVDNVVFSGDGSTTVFILPAAPVDAYSIGVYVAGSRSQDWTLSGGLLDTLTFGSAPASATDNIVVDIAAAL